MEAYYEQDGIQIFHGDCREVLPSLPKVDLVLTDPPYGINWKPRVNHQDQTWVDDVTTDVASLLPLASLHCFWGGNYFADQLPPSESWLIWLKRPAGFDDDPRTYAPVELAWTDYGGKPRVKTHVWDGGKRAGDIQNRTFCHPAQKPIEVMKWCVRLTEAQTILDPFMGSGTTLRAAKDLGRRAIGIEIEEKYCEIAAKRLSQGALNFNPTQEAMEATALIIRAQIWKTSDGQRPITYGVFCECGEIICWSWCFCGAMKASRLLQR